MSALICRDCSYSTVPCQRHARDWGAGIPQPQSLPPAVEQGWECPKCRRVYAPSTPMCFSCPAATTITTTVIPPRTGGEEWP